MSWIKNFLQISFFTIVLFVAIDFAVTSFHGSRGFSKFFVSDSVEGRKNKPGFSATFGSPLDEFKGLVSIGLNGERTSFTNDCENVKNTTLFIGDSTTAGFEVNDDKTFVSLYNMNCMKTKRLGVNFGVRAHDTHAVIGTYIRVNDYLPHDSVVYLMTENDFAENIDPNAYSMMSRRFGRRYESEILKPESTLMFRLTANLRSFVGDNFSFTTLLLSKSPIFLNMPRDKSFSLQKVNKATELITKLHALVSANGAHLYVIPYPNMRNKAYEERNNLVTHLEAEVRKELPQVSFVNIDLKTRELVERDGQNLQDMIFKNDGHLSEYGHKIISEVLIGLSI
jgi:lysophospholipase L1-like esterase